MVRKKGVGGSDKKRGGNYFQVSSFMWPSIKTGITERVGVLQAGEWGIS